jgi:hypothetical protein
MLVIYEPNRVRAGRLTISIISSDLELGVIFKEFSDEVLLATHDVHGMNLHPKTRRSRKKEPLIKMPKVNAML